MNCTDFHRLMDEERPLTKRELATVEQHADSCLSCAALLESDDEANEWDIGQDMPEAAVSEGFTDNVMQEILALEDASQRRRRRHKRVGLIAAGIAFTVTVGAAASPTFAEMLKSLFGYGYYVNVDHAAEMGFSERVEGSDTDQRITLSIHEILPDSPRVYVAYQIMRDGKVYEPMLQIDGKRNRLYVTDEDGNEYEVDSVGGGTSDTTISYINFKLPYGLEHKQLTLHMDILEVGGRREGVPFIEGLDKEPNPKVEGHWQVSVPFSFAKSTEATIRIPIDRSYTTPQGLSINVRNLVLTPTKTQLGLSHQLTEEAEQRKYRVKPLFWNELQKDERNMYELNQRTFMWQLVDESGAVVNDTSTSSAQLGRWPQGQKLTFRLDYEEHNELSDLSLTFRPADVRKGPVKLKAGGTEFMLSSFKLEPDLRNPSQTNAVMVIEGVMPAPLYRVAHWVLAQGSELKANFISVGTKTNEYEIREAVRNTGKIPLKYELRIKGYEEKWENEELQLLAPVITTRYYYEDDAWSFPIEVPPSSGMKQEEGK
ncbi:DUF4179 domain-containing protein [Paenibacillus sp. OSY-SE]|uniref:DUF4179 domain-containing protein n=1 Tax=Paenibacillus sp. OSY-SE TaxID=1196323 RepID=UPI0002DC3274|nr:DUF4179 domain-containing protein [Paenibacillus sp. OSY-SE]